MITAQVRRTLRDRSLVDPGQHILVACSGGVDSTVLLHVLHRLAPEIGVTVCAASINHGLRPEASAEVQGVAEFCESLGVPFRSAEVEVPAREPSLQARARTARYEALHQIAADFRADRIAVGHTQDDQAETVLARLLRGSGLRGLSGVAPRRRDGVIRPLLDCRRHDVIAYAAERNLAYVDDPSNHQPAYERVRIRDEVVPALVREDPRLVEHLCAIAAEASELNAWLEDAAPEIASPGQRFCLVSVLDELASPLRVRSLRHWLSRETGQIPTRRHLTDVGRLLTGPGEVLLGLGWSVRRQADRLQLEYLENRPTRSTHVRGERTQAVAKGRRQPHND